MRKLLAASALDMAALCASAPASAAIVVSFTPAVCRRRSQSDQACRFNFLSPIDAPQYPCRGVIVSRGAMCGGADRVPGRTARRC